MMTYNEQDFEKRIVEHLISAGYKKTISLYLDQQTAKIAKSISDSEKQIAFLKEYRTALKEYRTALISEAVTGKIDVRPPIDTEES